jgi:predicted HTH transcriptional regulator
MTNDLGAKVQAEMRARVKELRPLVHELERLEAAIAALDANATTSQGAHSTKPAGRRQNRSGNSGQDITAYVEEHPGVTAGDVAKALGVKRTTTATRLAQLAKAGKISKMDRGYGPSAS